MLVTRGLMGVELPGVCDDVNFRMGRFWWGGELLVWGTVT
jgi:hypothetical protein